MLFRSCGSHVDVFFQGDVPDEAGWLPDAKKVGATYSPSLWESRNSEPSQQRSVGGGSSSTEAVCASLLPVAERPIPVQMNIKGEKRPFADLLSQSALEKEIKKLQHGDGSTRCRLLNKQGSPMWHKQRAAQKWGEATPAQKWRAIRVAVTCFNAYHSTLDSPDDDMETWLYKLRRQTEKLNEKFRSLPEDEKLLWYTSALRGQAYKAVHPKPQIWGYFAALYDPARKRIRIKGMMLTWNGRWGDDCDELRRLLEAEPEEDCEIVAARLSKVHYVQRLCHKFFDKLIQNAGLLGIAAVSVSAEVSPHSAERRLHFHAFVHANSTFMRIENNEEYFKLGGVYPSHVSQTSATQSDRGTKGRVQEGHYYLQYPKIGKVFGLTNYAAWKDFIPRKKWITSQKVLGKMSDATYQDEVWKLQEGSLAFHREQEFRSKKVREQSLKTLITETDQMLSRHRQPAISWPGVVHDFMSQFKPENFGVLDRTLVLVLDGPTQYGKSTFIESMFAPHEIYTINCQGALKPPMSKYMDVWQNIKCIVMEETDWRIIIANKMLFQGRNKLFEMGVSPAEQHVYLAYTYQKAIICCGNKFLDGLDNKDDQDYIDANVMYFNVTDYLYMNADRAQQIRRLPWLQAVLQARAQSVGNDSTAAT